MEQLTLAAVCATAGREAGALTRRDVARALLTVPAVDALASLADLRRELVAAGNPLSAPFWESATSILTAIVGNDATIGQVHAWLEATGSEPMPLFSEGFVWPEEADRGPVAAEMHARLVAHLEELVAAGTIDPDRLVAGDEEMLAAYEQAQLEWLKTPLPDGREPIMAVSDEEDEEFLADWDAAEAEARRVFEELLDGVGPRPPCPEDDLQVACARIREELARGGRHHDVLRVASDVDPASMPDDKELWLTLAVGVINGGADLPSDDPLDIEVYSSWLAMDHASWIAAVITLARGGPASPADADWLVGQVASFDFEAEGGDGPSAGGAEEDWDDWEDWSGLIATDDDVSFLTLAFLTVVPMWQALGAVDEEERLTPLGWWGLPEALLRAWQPTEG